MESTAEVHRGNASFVKTAQNEQVYYANIYAHLVTSVTIAAVDSTRQRQWSIMIHTDPHKST
jgi:hypothetical protein